MQRSDWVRLLDNQPRRQAVKKKLRLPGDAKEERPSKFVVAVGLVGLKRYV